MAVTLNPHVPTAHSARAEAFLANGQPEAALASVRAAADVRALEAVNVVEGVVLYHLGRLEKARSLLQRRLSGPPQSGGTASWGLPAARAALAVTLVASGDSAEATAVGDQLEEAAPIPIGSVSCGPPSETSTRPSKPSDSSMNGSCGPRGRYGTTSRMFSARSGMIPGIRS